MARDELPKLLQDVLYGTNHRLLDDAVGQAAVQSVTAGVADDFVRDLISNRVHRHKVAQAFAGPFQLPHLGTGELSPGLDQRGRPIQFPVQYLNGHSLTVGGTGSGKTTKSRLIVLQVAPKVRGMWLFDLRKREFAVLRPYLARMNVELVVVPGRMIRLNPLQIPEGVDPADWAPRVADVIVRVLGLPPRATKLIHTTLLRLYRSFGTFDDSRRCPCLFELREAVAEDQEANPQSRHAILDSLDPVLMSLRPVLAYRRGWTTRELAGRRIVFELGGLAETDKDLILNSLLLAEFTSRVARGVSNPTMDLWICCDEAQRLASPNASSGGLSDLIGLVRGTGIGLDLSVQSADIAPTYLSNTSNKFIGRCGAATDYDAIGAAMGLNPDQRRWMSLNLRPGLFVGQVGEGDWRHPFLFEVPPMRIAPSGGSGTRGDRSNGGLDALLALPTEPADGFANWEPGATPSAHRASAESDSTSHTAQLSDAELRYLRAVIDNPGQPSSAYPKLAGIGPRRAQEIRRRLVEQGYLREHTVNTGRRGRAAIVLEPLEPARTATGGAA